MVVAINLLILPFVLISILFYIVFLGAILKFRHKPPFNSSFFTLTLSIGYADVAFSIHTLWWDKMRRWNWLNWPFDGIGPFARLGVCVNIYLIMVQTCGIFCISLNRFTAVCLPVQHLTLWLKGNMIWVLVFQWALPFIGAFPVLTQNYHFILTNDSHFKLITPSREFPAYYTLFLLLFVGLFTIGSGIPYMVMVCFNAYRRYSTLSKRRIRPTNRADLHLAIVGFCVFLALAIQFTFFLLVTYSAMKGNLAAFAEYRWMFYCTSDICTICNPWLIFIASPEVRSYMKRFILCRSPSNIEHAYAPRLRTLTVATHLDLNSYVASELSADNETFL